MKAGFIGLGTMGALMAANLQKAIQPLGHTLIVHDLNKTADLEHNGAVRAASPAELAAQSDIIFTSLPGPPEFEQVAYAEDGILSAIRPGTAHFDLTTNASSTVRKAHAAFALKLAHKDVSLATALGRELNVPMRLANLALADLAEGLNRGWGQRDARAIMVLQTERAGVEIKVDPKQMAEAIETRAKAG